MKFFHGLVLLTATVFCLMNTAIAEKTWAVLIVGFDKYMYSYSFEAGIYRMYQLLQKGGIPKENIIVISPASAPYNIQNPLPGVIVHGKNVTEIENVTNYYEDLVVDYNTNSFPRFTKQLFFEMLRGNSSALRNVGTGKVLKSGPEDNILLYYIGVGAYGLLTLQSEYIYIDEFLPVLEQLKDHKRFNKMFMIVESAETGSLFDDYLDTNKHIIVQSNCGRYTELQLCHFNPTLKAYTSTCNAYVMLEYLEKLIEDENQSEATLFDLHTNTRSLSFSPLEVGNLYGQLGLGVDKLNKFMGIFPKNSKSSRKNCRKVPTRSDSAFRKSMIRETRDGKPFLDVISEHDKDIPEFEKMHLQTVMENIVSESLKATDISFEMANDKVFHLPLNKFKCYRNAIETTMSHCYTKKNKHFLLVEAHKLANMCNLNVPAEIIEEAAKAVCSNYRKMRQ